MGKKRSRQRDFSSSEDERERLYKRVKKLERKMRKQKKKKSHHRHCTPSPSSCSSSTEARSRSESRESATSEVRNSITNKGVQDEAILAANQQLPPNPSDGSAVIATSSDAVPSQTDSEKSRDGDTVANTASTVQVSSQSDSASRTPDGVMLSSTVAFTDNTFLAPKQNSNIEASEKTVIEADLNPDVLNIIGQRLAEERVLASPIHSSFAVRWAEILKLGLPAEERTALIKKHSPPSNCVFLDPPRLNPEVVRAMTETSRARDKRIVEKQEKLTACILGIAKSISALLAGEKSEDIIILENLCDACRLISDSLRDEILIRRSLILANVNASMKETLSSANIDEFLFGKNLSDDLKSAKIIEQSAEEIKIKKVMPMRNSKNIKGASSQLNKVRQMRSGHKQTRTPSYKTQKTRHTDQKRSANYMYSRNTMRKQYSNRR